MSAESKKKRGVSGAANGKNISFRYGQNNACVPAGVPRAKPQTGSAFDKPIKGMSYREACEAERK